MSVSVRCSPAAVAAACTLGLLSLAFAFVLSDSASNVPKPVVPPAQAQNVIVVPSPDQVSNITNASVCTWQKTGTANTHPMSADSASSSALLLTAPPAAAEYAVNGMNGVSAVAGVYGC